MELEWVQERIRVSGNRCKKVVWSQYIRVGRVKWKRLGEWSTSKRLEISRGLEEKWIRG